jgi:serine/threonine protein kinase
VNERDLFIAAVQLDDDGKRAIYLDEACAHDMELRLRVESLLKAFGQAGRFLQQPVAGLAPDLEIHLLEKPGDFIGPYKLLEHIGEGGFGVVFLAEQERPVRRKVALKVIKPGMDTRQVIARFEAERQALAMMGHPNIAKVYDAGTTEHGRPYFVMELVQGVPITEYCDQCNLPTRERLELFVTVCQAVQHAHQKGVIHRDIKPTNVLVAIQDGRPAPKIIDFGVAKAIGQQLTEHTLMTAFAQIVGTPLYMSPEQAELSPLGVDTRSDIYSLGVLLYELLTGSTPLDKERLHAATYDELRRIIREDEPPRPSARISTLAADLATTVAEHRRTDARRLRQTVRSELDWIVMKCLEKDRNRRYETASSLAHDVGRYIADEPVHACPPSTSYRLRKFARRNRALLATGGVISAALIIGLGTSTWMYLRASTERARVQAISGVLQEMLGSASPSLEKDTEHSIRQLLIYDDIRIAYYLATTQREEEAGEFVRKAVQRAKRLTDPAPFANSLYYLALVQLILDDETGYRASCKALIDLPDYTAEAALQSRPIWTPCLAPNSLEDLNLLTSRAEAFAGNAPPEYRHVALTILGAAHYRAGQYERATDRFDEASAAYRSNQTPTFISMIDYQRLYLAMTKWQLGERDAARRLLAQMQAIVDRELESTSITWNRRATLEILRREAEALIQSYEADKAVENEGRISTLTTDD